MVAVNSRGELVKSNATDLHAALHNNQDCSDVWNDFLKALRNQQNAREVIAATSRGNSALATAIVRHMSKGSLCTKK